MKALSIQNVLSMLTGLLIAPAVWAINMQLGQILPYADCARQSRWSAIISLVGVAAAILASAVSWRSVGNSRSIAATATSRFIARVSALAGLMFVFALSMQSIASLVLSGCER